MWPQGLLISLLGLWLTWHFKNSLRKAKVTTGHLGAGEDAIGLNEHKQQHNEAEAAQLLEAVMKHL